MVKAIISDGTNTFEKRYPHATMDDVQLQSASTDGTAVVVLINDYENVRLEMVPLKRLVWIGGDSTDYDE